MENLDTHQLKDFGPVVVWAGDLVNVISILKDCRKVELTADDVKFDSVEEFVRERRGRKPSTVTVRAYEPYLWVEFSPRRAHLYVASSELLSSGLFLKVGSIVGRCERRPKFLFGFAWPIAGAVLHNIFYLPPLKPLALGYLHFGVMGLSFAWLASAFFIRLRRFSLVHPVFQEGRPSFIRRNADAIVIAIVSALLGALAGAAATKAVDRIWPNSPNTAVEKEVPQAAKPLAPP